MVLAGEIGEGDTVVLDVADGELVLRLSGPRTLPDAGDVVEAQIVD